MVTSASRRPHWGSAALTGMGPGSPSSTSSTTRAASGSTWATGTIGGGTTTGTGRRPAREDEEAEQADGQEVRLRHARMPTPTSRAATCSASEVDPRSASRRALPAPGQGGARRPLRDAGVVTVERQRPQRRRGLGLGPVGHQLHQEVDGRVRARDGDGHQEAPAPGGRGGGPQRVPEDGQRLGQARLAQRQGRRLGGAVLAAAQRPGDDGQVAARIEPQEAPVRVLEDVGLGVPREHLEVQDRPRRRDPRASQGVGGLGARRVVGVDEQRRDLGDGLPEIDLHQRVGREAAERPRRVDRAPERRLGLLVAEAGQVGLGLVGLEGEERFEDPALAQAALVGRVPLGDQPAEGRGELRRELAQREAGGDLGRLARQVAAPVPEEAAQIGGGRRGRGAREGRDLRALFVELPGPRAGLGCLHCTRRSSW